MFVPGSLECVALSRLAEIDIEEMLTNMETSPKSDQDERESRVFNVTATFAANLPDAIYDCYVLPAKAFQAWVKHYETFESMSDFEGAFEQNLMGNMLTFIDIYEQASTAGKAGDFQLVIYQMARFARKVIDFNSMQRGSLLL